MRRLWLVIPVLFFSASLLMAQSNSTCFTATGNAAPPITFSDQQDQNLNASLFTDQITAYLNTTHSTEGLQAAITTALKSDEEVQPWLTAQVLEVDVTTDGVVDVLTTINMAYGAGYENYTTIFGCSSGAFTPLDTVIHNDWANWFVEYEAPGTIEFIIDTNNNGIPEIILRERTLDGQKYGEKLTFFEWQTDHLAETLHMGPDYGGFGALWIANRDSNPTTTEVVIENRYGYGQAAATAFIEISHYRAVEDIYQWDGAAYQRICRVFADSPMTLFETLHSAEAYRTCQDYARAEAYYLNLWERRSQIEPGGGNPGWVIMPDNVTDRDAYAAELESAYLRAFAGYRLIQYHVQHGSTEYLDSILTELQADYPVGSHGHAYAAMANAYSTTYQTTRQADQACAAAQKAFDAARSRGDDPGIAYEEQKYTNGTVRYPGFYSPGIFRLSSNPDNLFEVPEEIAETIRIPVCFE